MNLVWRKILNEICYLLITSTATCAASNFWWHLKWMTAHLDLKLRYLQWFLHEYVLSTLYHFSSPSADDSSLALCGFRVASSQVLLEKQTKNVKFSKLKCSYVFPIKVLSIDNVQWRSSLWMLHSKVLTL